MGHSLEVRCGIEVRNINLWAGTTRIETSKREKKVLHTTPTVEINLYESKY